MIKTFLKTKIIHLIIVLSYRFNRVEIVGENNIKGIDSFILVSWHGKVLGLMEHLKHKEYFALVSQSRDGDLIADIAKKFGYNFFRGSSNKGGKEAIKNIDDFFKKNSGAKIMVLKLLSLQMDQLDLNIRLNLVHLFYHKIQIDL